MEAAWMWLELSREFSKILELSRELLEPRANIE